MPDDNIAVADEGPVRTVTIDRPGKRNAITGSMYLAMADALDTADGAGVRAVVLTGAGGSFTAGNDLNDFLAGADLAPAGAPPAVFLTSLATCPVPIVAAVDGVAVGVGATLLLHCDAVYVTSRTSLRFPFVQLGLVPEAASTMLLPATVGPIRAARAMLLGEPVTGEEAVAWGLATALVPDDEVLAAARGTAATLASLSADALRTTKRLLRAPAEPVADRMAAEAVEFSRLLAGDDFRAAAASVLGGGDR